MMKGSNNPKQRSLWFLLLAVIGVILLAAGFSTFELLPGEPFPYRLIFGDPQPSSSARPTPGFPVALIEAMAVLGMLLLILLLVLWLITFIIRPQARKRMLWRIITYFAILLVLYLFLEWFRRLAPAGENQVNNPAGAAPPEIASPLEALPTPPTFIVDPPAWLTAIITLIILTLILGIVWLLWQQGRQRQVQRLDQEKPLTILVEEAQQTIDQLNQGYDLKHSVLGCYRAMSRVLKEDRGIERSKTMTARDFEYHLGELGLGDEHIQRLTRLFERFRYGSAKPNQSDEAEAIDCLSAIVKTYGRSS